MEHLIMMRRFRFIALLGLCVAGTLRADPSSMVAFDESTLNLLANASITNGQKEAAVCIGCHGEQGIALLHQAGNVAGQRASYLFKQLQDFRDGHRIRQEMNNFARGLNDQQMADISVWYESLPNPAFTEPATVDPAIRKLVYRGDPERLLKSCSSCHGRSGEGGQFSHPMIAGQTREYLVQSLRDFRDGSRKNDIWSRMRMVARGLTDQEIEGLADFYAGAQ